MDPWLVVGLGNPGPKYAGHRHNIGAMVIAELADQAGASAKEHKGRAWVSEVRLGTLPGGAPGPRAILAQPMTYMNVSGGPVAALVRFYKVPLEQIKDVAPWLKEGETVNMVSHNGELLGLEPAHTVERRITKTDPGVRGDTAQGGTKPAVIEGGVTVTVPLFVNEGEVIRVDTRSGEYLERVSN